MPDGEESVLAKDNAMDTLQDHALRNSITGCIADEPAEEPSPEVFVETPVQEDNAEVENRSVLSWDGKPDPSHGEDSPPTTLDEGNAEEPNGGVVDQQATQEAEGTSTEEVVETTPEQ
ncbi:unnamed protein product, partial [Laminaria digitata]